MKEKGKMVVEWERGMDGRGRTSGDGDKNVENWKWGGWIGWLGNCEVGADGLEKGRRGNAWKIWRTIGDAWTGNGKKGWMVGEQKRAKGMGGKEGLEGRERKEGSLTGEWFRRD